MFSTATTIVRPKFATTVEHPKYGETDVNVEFNYIPAVPGQLGRGEFSYPAEPAEVEIISITIVRCHEIKDIGHEGEEIELETLSSIEQEKLEDRAMEMGAENMAAVYEARGDYDRERYDDER